MKKRVIVLLMCIVMAVGLFTGCGKTSESDLEYTILKNNNVTLKGYLGSADKVIDFPTSIEDDPVTNVQDFYTKEKIKGIKINNEEVNYNFDGSSFENVYISVKDRVAFSNTEIDNLTVEDVDELNMRIAKGNTVGTATIEELKKLSLKVGKSTTIDELELNSIRQLELEIGNKSKVEELTVKAIEENTKLTFGETTSVKNLHLENTKNVELSFLNDFTKDIVAIENLYLSEDIEEVTVSGVIYRYNRRISKVHGKTGTYAEEFAKKCGLIFVDGDKETDYSSELNCDEYWQDRIHDTLQGTWEEVPKSTMSIDSLDTYRFSDNKVKAGKTYYSDDRIAKSYGMSDYQAYLNNMGRTNWEKEGTYLMTENKLILLFDDSECELEFVASEEGLELVGLTKVSLYTD